MLNVKYELCGVINGHPIVLDGQGAADPTNGTYELEVDLPKIPLHWDPALIILICCDRLTGVFSKELEGAQNLLSQGGGQHSLGPRGGPIFDPNSRPLGRAMASSTGRRDGDTIYSKSQILEANFHLAFGERVTKILTPYCGFMQPLGSERHLITTTYTFNTTKSENCYGYTNYPVEGLASSQANKVFCVEMLDVDFHARATSNGGERFSFRTRSEVRQLA